MVIRCEPWWFDLHVLPTKHKHPLEHGNRNLPTSQSTDQRTDGYVCAWLTRFVWRSRLKWHPKLLPPPRKSHRALVLLQHSYLLMKVIFSLHIQKANTFLVHCICGRFSFHLQQSNDDLLEFMFFHSLWKNIIDHIIYQVFAESSVPTSGITLGDGPKTHILVIEERQIWSLVCRGTKKGRSLVWMDEFVGPCHATRVFVLVCVCLCVWVFGLKYFWTAGGQNTWVNEIQACRMLSSSASSVSKGTLLCRIPMSLCY